MTAVKKSTTKAKPAANAVAAITIDRRGIHDRRRELDRRTKNEPVSVERRVVQRREKVNRRRQIDPTTCERDYTGDEIEFMNAMDNYKRTSGRMFPTCSEVLEVIRSLGYQKCPLPQPEQPQPEPAEQPQPVAMPILEVSVGATHGSVVVG